MYNREWPIVSELTISELTVKALTNKADTARSVLEHSFPQGRSPQIGTASRGKRFSNTLKAEKEGGAETEEKNHIGFEVRWIQNLIEAAMREKRENDGFCVTQLQHWIIRYLEHNQEADIFQKDLEEEFHVSRATISSTLQVMERNGMICRTAVKQDARLKKITLTDKARQFSRHAKKNVQEMEECMEKGMTKEERDELIRLLRRVRRNLEENEAGRHEICGGGKIDERRENHLC